VFCPTLVDPEILLQVDQLSLEETLCDAETRWTDGCNNHPTNHSTYFFISDIVENVREVVTQNVTVVLLKKKTIFKCKTISDIYSQGLNRKTKAMTLQTEAGLPRNMPGLRHRYINEGS
jgi:hypothetical protein